MTLFPPPPVATNPPGTAERVVFGEDVGTNTALRIVGGMAYRITSADADAPYVDAVSLESANAGALGRVARVQSLVYETALPLAAARVLFLGPTGGLVPAPPASGWLVPVARRMDDSHFLFNPMPPIARA